jgi:hypothetical protein
MSSSPKKQGSGLFSTSDGLLPGGWLAFFCVTVAVIGVILHCRRHLWFDELTTVMTWQRPLLDGLTQIEDYSAPAYQMLMRLSWHHGYPPEWVLRAPAFLSALLGLASIGWLAKMLFNNRVAALAMGIVAFNPVYLRYTVEARPYTLFIFLSTLSMAAFWQSLRRPTRLLFWLHVCASTFLVYSHYFGFLVLFAEASFCTVYAVCEKEQRPALRRMVTAFVIIGLAVLPAVWLSSRYVFAGLEGLRSNVPTPARRTLVLLGIGQYLFESGTLSVLCFWAIVATLATLLRPTDSVSAAIEGASQSDGGRWFWAPLLCLFWFGWSYYLLIAISVLGKPIVSNRYVLPAMVPCAILLSRTTFKLPRLGQALILFLIVGAYYAPDKAEILQVRDDYPALVAQLQKLNPNRTAVYVAGCADYDRYLSGVEVGLRYYGYDEPNIATLKLSWNVGEQAYVVREPNALLTHRRCFVVTHWPGYARPVEACLERSARQYRKDQYGELSLFEVGD